MTFLVRHIARLRSQFRWPVVLACSLYLALFAFHWHRHGEYSYLECVTAALCVVNIMLRVWPFPTRAQ
jgi:hypothetical protein